MRKFGTSALDEAKVKQRKFKAEHDRNAKANHSHKYIELLGWAVYLTNVQSFYDACVHDLSHLLRALED